MSGEPKPKDDSAKLAPGSLPKEPPSPLFSFIIISSTIFAVEFCIMLAEDSFKFLSPIVWDVIDATILLVVTNPVLYFFVYKPLAYNLRTREELLKKEIAEKAEIVRKDELIQLINEITFAVNDAETIEDALNVCLARICRHVGWPVGHALRVAPDSDGGIRLVSTNVWYLESPKQYGAFRKVSVQTAFKAGEGGPGVAYLEQKTIWISDLGKMLDFPWAERIKSEGVAAGLKGGFFFPVMVGKKAVGVLEFFSEKVEEADPVVIGVISKLAIQMGRVMERKEAEMSVKTLSSAIEQATESLVLTDPDGTIVYVNPAFERETGYSKLEAVGQALNTMTSPGQQGKDFFHEMWAAAKTGKVWSGQVTTKKKNGDLHDVEMTISPIEDQAGIITHFIVIKRDVTEKKLLQNHLIQAEKMFTVGAFVSGVAHELNNPLTAILGFSQKLVAKGGDFPPNVTHQLKIISEQTKRAVKIVQNLLKFSRKNPATTIYCDINEVLESTLAFLEYGLRSDNIEVRKNYVHDPVCVKGDVSQLQQVFTNIILNGEYEMKKARGGGVMLIHTEITGGEARIEIENDGPPIPPQVRERLFDPFYSTKGIGEGTGLGLYIAYGIINDHKGKLWAESPGDNGTRFIVTLPLAELGPAVTAAPAKESPTGVLGGKRVLVVEDEEYIRKWLFELLEDNGAAVHVAKDGNDAMELLKQNKYDLVISDIRMPGMTGDELGQWIYENKPEYRSSFLFITGVIDRDVGGFCKKYGYRYLQKPFGANELLTTIRDMKDNPTEDN